MRDESRTAIMIEDIEKLFKSASAQPKMNIKKIFIIKNEILIEKLKRSFKERFFSLPWQPWKKYKEIPSDVVIISENEQAIICHPAYYNKISNALKVLNNERD